MVKCSVGLKVFVLDCNRGSNGKKHRFLESVRNSHNITIDFWKETQGFCSCYQRGLGLTDLTKRNKGLLVKWKEDAVRVKDWPIGKLFKHFFLMKVGEETAQNFTN